MNEYFDVWFELINEDDSQNLFQAQFIIIQIFDKILMVLNM